MKTCKDCRHYSEFCDNTGKDSWECTAEADDLELERFLEFSVSIPDERWIEYAKQCGDFESKLDN